MREKICSVKELRSICGGQKEIGSWNTEFTLYCIFSVTSTSNEDSQSKCESMIKNSSKDGKVKREASYLDNVTMDNQSQLIANY